MSSSSSSDSSDSSDDDDVSVLSEENYNANDGLKNGKKQQVRQQSISDDESSEEFDSSDEESFGGGSNDEGEDEGKGRRGHRRVSSADSFGGESREDLGQSADELIQLVENYLRDYDGPIEEDEELKEIRAALKEAQDSLEKSREAAEQAEQERQGEIENVKQNIRRIKRTTLERQASIEESSITSREADQKRHSIVKDDLEELDRSGHEMKEMNAKFEKQKRRIKRKSTKREALAVEMKLGAKKAMRRLRMVNVKARIAREADGKAAKEALIAQKNCLDMSEKGRRERIHGYYMRFAMPKRILFERQIKDLPPSSGTVVEDIALLPWDERGLRVHVGKLNKVMLGMAKADW